MQRFCKCRYLLSGNIQVRVVKTLDLNEVVAGCRKGKARAQKVLYELLAPKMYPICLRYTKNKMDAQDVLQEGFIKLFSNIGKLEDANKLEAWSKRIFINCSLRHLEKGKGIYFTEVSEHTEALKQHQFAPCEYNDLICMINELAEGYRAIFNLYVIDGYSHKEIGAMFEISENTSRSQLNRARNLLQKKLELNNKKANNESAG